MTDGIMNPKVLAEKAADADVLCAMSSFAAERLIE
jgi:hypothetical protein